MADVCSFFSFFFLFPATELAGGWCKSCDVKFPVDLANIKGLGCFFSFFLCKKLGGGACRYCCVQQSLAETGSALEWLKLGGE